MNPFVISVDTSEFVAFKQGTFSAMKANKFEQICEQSQSR